ncbi:MAG TPA: FtsX-like permease family protein, partial [Rhodothermales bacterium]|nr:FtsX-like permease family protein [Rhodothermales bacterium]
GTGSQSGGLRLRKVLVASQFAFSLIFMVTMVALYQQLQLMTHADYGFDDERVVNVAMPGVTYETLRAALLTDPAITKVSATSKLPASGSVNGVWVHLEERADPLRGYEYAIDEHFIDNLGLQLVAGRNFSSAFAADSVQSVIINETAVQDFGYSTPAAALGHTLRMEDGPPVEVVGVVKNYHFNLLVDAIKPMLLHYDPQAFRYANLRVQPGEMERALAHLEATWQQLKVAYPLEYEIFSDQLASNPINVVFRDFIRIIGLVAGLAVIIACLGLFGMAAYSAQVRVREVGVRKVLGASVADVVGLLSKDYVKLVSLAALIAAPLAWGLNNLWLQQFARRIDFGFGVLFITTGVLLVLAFLTIASQTIRAALTNPVDTLRAK